MPSSSQDVLEPPIESAVWQDELFGAPWNANTQLLWYKKSVAEAAGIDPTAANFTWDEMIDAAVQTNTKVAEQGNRYEGYMVWVNAMVLGAGGEILENTDAGRDADVTIDSPEGSRGRRDHQQAGELFCGDGRTVHLRSKRTA